MLKNNKIFKKLKDFITLNYEVVDDEPASTVVVGKCPNCGKDVIASEGFYFCVGSVVSNSCDFKKPMVLNDKTFSFEFIVQYEQYKQYEKHLEKQSSSETDSKVAKESSPTTNSLGKCPKCGGDIIEEKTRYSCSSPECDTYLYKVYAKTLISSKDIALMLKGEISNWMEFTKKDGSKYKGRLSLDLEKFAYKYVPYEKNSDKKNSNDSSNKKDSSDSKVTATQLEMKMTS